MNVFVCMPELRLKKAKFNRELYVVSFASDLRGESNHRPPAVGAGNKTLASFTPDIESAMKFFVMAASNIFHGIDKDQPPQLGGDGIVIYPPADPQGMLALHISIVESDAGIRNQGKLLGEVFGKKEIKDVLGEISKFTSAAGPIPANLLTAAMAAITSVLPGILEKNGDNVYLDYNFSGRSMGDYHGSPQGEKHSFENKKAAASITIFTE